MDKVCQMALDTACDTHSSSYLRAVEWPQSIRWPFWSHATQPWSSQDRTMLHAAPTSATPGHALDPECGSSLVYIPIPSHSSGLRSHWTHRRGRARNGNHISQVPVLPRNHKNIFFLRSSSNELQDYSSDSRFLKIVILVVTFISIQTILLKPMGPLIRLKSMCTQISALLGR